MKILAIETSCDETAISIIEAKGSADNMQLKVLSNVVSSQVKLHAKWGGVVPNLARREHERNIIPILKKSLKKAGLLYQGPSLVKDADIEKILEREPELSRQFLKFISKVKIPKVDAIAVTYGPGLEPALWVGVNFSKALSFAWKKPLIPINHMEGHIAASLLGAKDKKVKSVQFPALALLVSGGHTELVLMKDWLKYKIIGQTRDDAVGEAFDKVARMLGLEYPGGPIISKLASLGGLASKLEIKLPRPMINSGDFDFSFSGLKTAVLYLVQKLSETENKQSEAKKSSSQRMPTPTKGGVHPKENSFLSEAMVAAICREFQQAVIDVLVSKTINAGAKHKAKTIIIGGGVAANKELHKQLSKALEERLPGTSFLSPLPKFTTDNATMIAVASYLRLLGTKDPAIKSIARLKAEGNLKLK